MVKAINVWKLGLKVNHFKGDRKEYSIKNYLFTNNLIYWWEKRPSTCAYQITFRPTQTNWSLVWYCIDEHYDQTMHYLWSRIYTSPQTIIWWFITVNTILFQKHPESLFHQRRVNENHKNGWNWRVISH